MLNKTHTNTNAAPLVLLVILFLNSFSALAQCGNINFKASDTIICAPSFTQFSVQNLPAGASVKWNFGNGNLSGNVSPTRLYEFAGEYDISLEITLVTNAVCTITKNKYIKAKAKPEINITWDKTALCSGPGIIQITDSSQNIIRRDYLIGGILHEQVPKTFEYLTDSTPGRRSLYVFTTDSFGCTNTKAYDTAFYMFYSLDSLGFEIDYSPKTHCSPSRLSFSRTINNLDEHVLKSFSWQLNGSTVGTSTASQPSNILFNTQGVFDISHTVTTEAGCVYTITKPEWIELYDSLSPNISYNKTNVCSREEITFTLNNSVTDNIVWNVGDYPAVLFSQSGNQAKIGFNELGTHGMSLNYTNGKCIAFGQVNNIVTVKGPVALFDIPLDRSCYAPDTFKIINKSILTGAPSATFRWEIKNTSNNSILGPFTHSDSFQIILFDTAEYEVKLVVDGNNGCFDSLVVQDAITLDSLIPIPTIVPFPACPGQLVTLNQNTADGKSNIKSSHYWEVYNKNSSSILFSDTVLFNQNNPRINFPDTGTYRFLLKAFNNKGCSGQEFFDTSIQIISPEVTFEISNPVICRTDSTIIKVNFPTVGDYANYFKRIVLQHVDTSIFLVSNGTERTFWLNYPGEYKVSFVYVSPSGVCRDTVKHNTTIRVNGSILQVKGTDLDGCAPLVANWNASVLKNYNFSGNNLPNQYLWRSRNNFPAIFSPNNTLNTQATHTNKGVQRIWIRQTHASGCIDSFFGPEFDVGTRAIFSTQSTVRCINTSTQVSNESTNGQTFKWISEDTSAIEFLPNDTTKSPTIKVKKEGDYRVSLISIGKGGCTDTAARIIRVINPKPDFYTSDSVQFCAPVLVSFVPKAVRFATEYRWYFGDGDTFTSNKPLNASHIYKNNTDSNGIAVKLVVINSGCRDTIVKQNAVRIIGPIPKYSINKLTGCEPLEVTFTNQSKNFSQFYFDYGDGNVLDSTDFRKYSYKILDKALNVQCFKTRLVLVDANGCFASYNAPNDICITKNAEPNFTVSDTIGCENFTVEFQNRSLYASSFQWDFEGKGNFVSGPPITSYVFKSGKYKPSIVGININGCRDTFTAPFTLHIQPKPKANFIPLSDSICVLSGIHFQNTSTSSNKLTKYAWDFGNPDIRTDTSSQKDPFYTFQKTLLNDIRLIVTDSNNCKDTINKFIYVHDTIPPTNNGLDFITIQNNKDIFASWSESKLGNFSKYGFYLDDVGYSLLHQTNNRKDTTFKVNTGINVSQKRYCYTLQIVDSCNIDNLSNKSHCSVYFWTEKTNPGDLSLNWLHYVGWENTDRDAYIIYRSEDNKPFVAIDTIPGEFSSYTDTRLCEKNYCYYVEAVHKNKKWRSASNISCETPNYVYPTEIVEPILTTVADNNYIDISWKPYTSMRYLSHYELSRIEHSKNNLYIDPYDTTQKVSYTDRKADVQNSAYTYFIRPVDHCGYKAPKSEITKSILLQNNFKNYEANLTWNRYKQWSDGVLKYIVEFENEMGEFETKSELNSNDTFFFYRNFNLYNNKPICFRVKAIRTNGLDTSTSNTNCIQPESQVFTPNAFSPNNDGINEEFKPSAIYIFKESKNSLYSYSMEVFDRWGSKVFDSKNLDKGWDGKIEGKDCPQGIYMYTIKAIGLDGKIYQFQGTLHLIR